MCTESGKGNCGSTLLAFFLGAATGAGIALLLAPKSGEEVRGELKDLACDAVEKTREYARTAQEKAKSAIDQASEAVREKVDQAKSYLS